MPLHNDRLRIHLAQGPRPARLLQEVMQISQPTLSRAVAQLGREIVRIGAARSIRYALRDTTRGFLDVPVYQVNSQGQLLHLGTLIPVRPDGLVMQRSDGTADYTEGVPWWLFDMRPQGFLGRAYAHRHAQALGLPPNLLEWSDADAIRTLIHHGQDTIGNVLLGDVARDRFLALSPAPVIPASDKALSYVRLAQEAVMGEMPGSSAGGEQPKFTALTEAPDGVSHVIVKFSLADHNPVTERWRDLLLAEHHALETLREAGLPAAHTTITDACGQRFLEVARFDRVGENGRRALLSLAALEAEFVGKAPAPWPILVAELVEQRIVEAQALPLAQAYYAFGQLIGNTDMHPGNLSFVRDDARLYSLSPVYDMLPMAFAPRASGALGNHISAVSLHPSVPHDVWHDMLPIADRLLKRVMAEPRFSASFSSCFHALGRHLENAAKVISRIG